MTTITIFVNPDQLFIMLELITTLETLPIDHEHKSKEKIKFTITPSENYSQLQVSLPLFLKLSNCFFKEEKE